MGLAQILKRMLQTVSCAWLLCRLSPLTVSAATSICSGGKPAKLCLRWSHCVAATDSRPAQPFHSRSGDASPARCPKIPRDCSRGHRCIRLAYCDHSSSRARPMANFKARRAFMRHARQRRTNARRVVSRSRLNHSAGASSSRGYPSPENPGKITISKHRRCRTSPDLSCPVASHPLVQNAVRSGRLG